MDLDFIIHVQETVIECVKRGAKVITGCRDLSKAAAVQKLIKDQFNAELVVEKLDLADLESVKTFASRCLQEERLDILVNNAGLMMPEQGKKTKQGFEVQITKRGFSALLIQYCDI